jgi:hypothetical protein
LLWLGQAPEGLETVNQYKFSDSSAAGRSLYVLFGWSTSGADELRRAAVDSVIVNGNLINVYVSRPKVELDGAVGGTADMRFVGWEIPLWGKLPPGNYEAQLHLRRDTIRVRTMPAFNEEKVVGEGYKRLAEIEFAQTR